MPRRALLVGIDYYESLPDLNGCVGDVNALRTLLRRNDDGSLNYECRTLVNPGGPLITKNYLRQEWHRLFAHFTGDLLFYFAGHGTPTDMGGYLTTHDATPQDPGLPMNELLNMANQSRAGEVLLILDCCYSGAIGISSEGTVENSANLREGVTILAASRATEPALQVDDRGLFTQLLVGALDGAAADIRGNISAASLYAHIEQALGAWDQRPMYKSHASTLMPVRRCTPMVPDLLLRQLPLWFATPDAPHVMAPSYEHTEPTANPAHVAIFDAFKGLRNAHLIATEDDRDLYYTALAEGQVRLTPLGRFYWKLAKEERI